MIRQTSVNKKSPLRAYSAHKGRKHFRGTTFVPRCTLHIKCRPIRALIILLSSEATFRKRCLSGLSATALTLCKVLSFPTPLHRHSMKFITLIFYRVFAEKSRVSGNSAERNYVLYVPLVPYSGYSMVHSLSYHRNPRRPMVIHRFTGFPPAEVSSTTLRLGSKS